MQAQGKSIIIIGDTSEELGFQCREMLRDTDREVILTQKDGKELWEKIQQMKPELVVMDAVMPHYDAVNILRKMRQEQMEISVIVIAPSGNHFMEEEIIRCGAYCMVKPIDMQYLKECICGMLKAKVSVMPAGFRKAPQSENRVSSLEVAVTDVIFSVGVPAHIKGYTYLRKAILLAIANPDMINSVTKTLYPEVAKAYGTTSSRVERAIRHAIEVAWDRGDVEVLDSYFGYTINTGRGKPTNSEFIAMIADRLRLKNKDLIEAQESLLY